MQYLKYSAAIAAMFLASGALADPKVKPAKPGYGAEASVSESVEWSEYNGDLATVGALHVPHAERNFAVSGSVGSFYGGAGAVGLGAGLGFAVRLNDNWQVGGSAASGFEGATYSGKAVVTGQF